MCFIGRQFVEYRDPASIVDQNLTSASPLPLPSCTRYCHDYYVPVFSIVEFLFYVGWFKVAQDIMRPFEEDDDDYELNYILDRNIKVSVAIVNSCIEQKPSFPPAASFSMWEDAHSVDVPYTRLSKPERNHPPKMHAYVDVKNPEDCEVFKHGENQQKSAAAVLRREQTKRWRYF